MLDLEKLKNLQRFLPDKFKIDFNIPRVERVVYKTVNGYYLPVFTSTVKNKQFSYNICTDFYKKMGCEFMVFVIGDCGLAIVPIEIVRKYNNFGGWKMDTKKGRQFWIRGRYDPERSSIKFVSINCKEEDVDLTPYFIKIK